jgi:hypothetical protein
MRTFKLTDDCTLSGLRLLPEDRRVDGGGYFQPDCSERLVPAHGFVSVKPPGLRIGEKLVLNDYNR